MSLSPVLVGPSPVGRVCASASGAMAAQARAMIFNFIWFPFISVSVLFWIRVPMVVWMLKRQGKLFATHEEQPPLVLLILRNSYRSFAGAGGGVISWYQ